MQGAREISFLEAPCVEEVCGDLEPHGLRDEGARGQVEWVYTEHGGGVDVAHLVTGDLVGDLDLPEAHVDVTPPFAALDLAHADR